MAGIWPGRMPLSAKRSLVSAAVDRQETHCDPEQGLFRESEKNACRSHFIVCLVRRRRQVLGVSKDEVELVKNLIGHY